MVLEVAWSRKSLRNVVSIRQYIGRFNPVVAQRMADKLVGAGISLGDHPDRGRHLRANVRELTVISPYVIRYRVEPSRVVIIRVRHGARRPDLASKQTPVRL